MQVILCVLLAFSTSYASANWLKALAMSSPAFEAAKSTANHHGLVVDRDPVFSANDGYVNIYSPSRENPYSSYHFKPTPTHSGCTTLTNLYRFSKSAAESINIGSKCVRFYEHIGCTGEYLELKPGVREKCQKSLASCGWKNRISSMVLCKDDVPYWTQPRTSRGYYCSTSCSSASGYFWCGTTDGWDYCSQRNTQDYTGDLCLSSCGYRGYKYQWCRTSRGWGYCSSQDFYN